MTQSGGLRPFGVSLLIAGIDDGPKLYRTDPTGIYNRYNATVIGEGEEQIQPVLHKSYREEMTLDQGLKLAVHALKQFLGDQFNVERVDAAIVPFSTKMMRRVNNERIAKLG